MKPVVLQNVLDDRLLSIIQQYMKHAIVNQVSSNTIKLDDGQESLRYSIYGEPLAQVILKELTSLCSDAAGKDLYPTHSFLSLYVPGSELRKHRDRPECEYTATVSIYNESDGLVWPIFIETPNGESAEINLKPGDAALYKGHESEHWRERQHNGYYISLFLHFVDRDGEYADTVDRDIFTIHDNCKFKNDITISEVLRQHDTHRISRK